MVITFGKYVGKDVAEVPSNYLEWLLGEDGFEERRPELAIEMKDELETRTRSDAHFYD